MSLIRGLVLDVANQLGGAMPGVVTLHDWSRFENDLAFGAGANAPTWAQLPSGLWCLELDGVDDYVSIASNPSINPTIGLTIEFWTYIVAHKSFNYFLHKAIWAVNTWGITCNAAGTMYFQLRNNANNTWEEAGISPAAGVWQHIALTVDYPGSVTRTYLDGVAGGVDSTPVGVIEPENNTQILYLGNTANSLDGRMALVRLYDYALTPAQIRARYHSQKWLFGVAS